MKLIAVSQRVVIDPVTRERRDALDQRLDRLPPRVSPGAVADSQPCRNRANADAAENIRGVLLTGGNDLAACGGDAPERDAAELCLIEEAGRMGRPVLGVCRGMQLLQHRAGVPLQRVAGHVGVRHQLALPDGDVNSFHGWGATATVPGLEIRAAAADGVIEAVVDRQRRCAGMMWHPERETPFRQRHLEFVERWMCQCEIQGADCGL